MREHELFHLTYRWILQGLLVLCLSCSWMANSRPIPLSQQEKATYCNSIIRLSRKQRMFCMQHTAVVKVFEEGFHQGIKECTHQFHNNSLTRWNCTNVAGYKNRNVLYGVALGTGTKEGAVMHAYIAAGMLYNLFRKCAGGSLKECSITDIYKNDTGQGQQGSRSSCKEINWTIPMKLLFGFLIPRQNANFRTFPNRHMNDINHAVGAVAVMRNTIQKYGCSYGAHGMQRCPFARTCREELTDFRTIAKHLYRKYTRAKLIIIPSSGLVQSGDNSDDDSSLKYFRKSPTYCGPNDSFLWGGIGGRRCRPQVTAKDSCNVMCCGFGYMTMIEVVQHNCRLIAGHSITLQCDSYEEYRHYCKFEKMVIRKGRRVKKNPLPLAEVRVR